MDISTITDSGKEHLQAWVKGLRDINVQESAHQAAYHAAEKYTQLLCGTLTFSDLNRCTLCAFALDRRDKCGELKDSKCMHCPLYHCGHGCFEDHSAYQLLKQKEPSDKLPAYMHMRDILLELTALLAPNGEVKSVGYMWNVLATEGEKP